MPSSSLLRIDPLTGCFNLLAFIEWLGMYFTQPEPEPVTVLSLDINRFSAVNRERGHAEGDTVLRWVGIVLRETSQSPVYRTGGDEFTVVVHHDSTVLQDMEPRQEENAVSTALAHLIFDRLSQDAAQICLETPPASLSVIHFPASNSIQPDEALLMVGSSIMLTKERFQRGFHEFEALDLRQEIDPATMRWFAGRMIENMVLLGRKLDEIERLAFTDPVTGMPNQRAADNVLVAAIVNAAASELPLAVILIDGDDLKAYNDISYAAGDDMIRRLAETLQVHLRPGDFLARWRVGDEFLVVLPETNLIQAQWVGERLIDAVRTVSQKWLIPISISAGLAVYPDDGTSALALLEAAERANMHAKTQGKDRLSLA